MQQGRALAILGALLSTVALAAPARATDAFEIQVYEGDHDAPGQPSLELHTNYTLAGRRTPSYPGEIPAHGALRLTLEPAIGVTEWLELGAYLQGMRAGEGDVHFAGWKLRAKLMAPERLGLPLVLGINVEIGRVPYAIEPDGWANEFRPIVGARVGRVTATVNPIFGFALTGTQAFQPEIEPAAKVRVSTELGFALGGEYYAGLGPLGAGFLPVRAQEHLVFATFDLEDEREEWELNVGVGRGLTSGTPQEWVTKAIVGRAF